MTEFVADTRGGSRARHRGDRFRDACRPGAGARPPAQLRARARHAQGHGAQRGGRDHPPSRRSRTTASSCCSAAPGTRWWSTRWVRCACTYLRLHRYPARPRQDRAAGPGRPASSACVTPTARGCCGPATSARTSWTASRAARWTLVEEERYPDLKAELPARKRGQGAGARARRWRSWSAWWRCSSRTAREPPVRADPRLPGRNFMTEVVSRGHGAARAAGRLRWLGRCRRCTTSADGWTCARRLYAKRDAALAIDVLAPFSTSSTGAADVDEAVYLLGLCHLQVKDWMAAQADFERLQRDYPRSDSARRPPHSISARRSGDSRASPDFDQEFTLKRARPVDDVPPRPPRPLAGARGDAAHRRSSLAARDQALPHRRPVREAQGVSRRRRRYYQERADRVFRDSTLYGDAWIGWAVASCAHG